MANMARRILDAIETYPDSFDMDNWYFNIGGNPLRPDQAPSCGTTLCVAGWAAHLSGWTLSNGEAIKNGEKRYISDVGAEALGLDDEASVNLFFGSDSAAREILEEMAD